MELYKEIYLPSHHRAKKCGCVDEHIIIAEKKLGRDLKPNEVVHHKDLNKRNNDPENLMVFVSNAAHSKFHRGGELISLPDGTYDCIGIKDREMALGIVYKCEVCGKELKTRGAHICQECSHIKQYKCKHPNKEELLKDIEELKTNVAISKKYGVSDKTIAKWREKILK